MGERVYQLFFNFNNTPTTEPHEFESDLICEEIGYVIHEISDDFDRSNLTIFLMDNEENDFKNRKIFKPESVILFEDYHESLYSGLVLDGVEELFCFLNEESINPCTSSVPCLNNEIYIEERYDATVEMEDENSFLTKRPLTIDDSTQLFQEDWVKKYHTDDGLFFDKLINDEYLESIKILYRERKYTAALKLLLIAIDTFSYLDNAKSNPTNFQRWLDNYCDLSCLKITSSEVWELRNGLLHMTNLDSRLVRKNTVRKISYAIGTSGEKEGIYYFDFNDFYDAIAKGIINWGNSYNQNSSKFNGFIARFDKVVTEVRPLQHYL